MKALYDEDTDVKQMAYYETRKQRKRRAYHPDDMTTDGRKRKACETPEGARHSRQMIERAMTAWVLQIAIEAYLPTVDRSVPRSVSVTVIRAHGDTYSSHTL